MLPVDKGDLKTDTYLVRLSDRTPLNMLFDALSTYVGSSEYEQGRDATLQHLLYAIDCSIICHHFSGIIQALHEWVSV